MPDYFYDMDLVVDPLNPSNVVAMGSVAIYDPADTAGTTLLALKDPSGLPLPNPLTSNANGFLPPRIAQVPQTLWKSGGFEGYFNSFKGLRDEAVGANNAAQSAANSATAAVAQVVTTAAVDGSGVLVLTKANGSTVSAGNVRGAQGVPGPPGLNGSNVLPTVEAVEQALVTPGPAKKALDATYAEAPAYRAGRKALAEFLGFKAEVPPIATLGTKVAEGDPNAWAVGKNVVWGADATGLDPRFRVTRGAVTKNATFVHSVARTKSLFTPPANADYVIETRITGATVSVLAIIDNQTEQSTVYVDGYKMFNLPKATPEQPYPGAQIMYPITFPDDRPRTLTIHMTQGGKFQGLLLATGATASYPTAAPRGARWVIAGDSFTEGAGVDTAGTGYISVLSTMLKADIWNSGIGSTGYVSTGGLNADGLQKVKLADRLTNDVISIAPNVVGFAMGRNDLTFSHASVVTQATACWDATRAALPDADIFVIGPFWEHCPVTEAAAQESVWLNSPAVLLDNLLAAAAAARGLFYISPVKERWLTGAGKVGAPANDGGNADYAVSTDGVHPTTAGHQIIAWRLAGHLQQMV